VESGDAWDLVFWPTVGPINSYADQLVALDSIGGDAANYAPAWMTSVNGTWLGVAVKADPKSIVWYSPVNFDAFGYTVPTTWDEFVALADDMAGDGNTPFSMGFESGDATGWTASDFIQDILLATQGSAYVNGTLDGSIPYNDAGVVEAYEIYSGWATDPAYAVGGAEGSLSTSFSDAILKPFGDPPEAMMVKQSGFAGGAIAAQYPELQFGTDFSFFHFPGADGVQGGADWMMAFSDSPAVQAIVHYLTSAEGGAHWASVGFGLSPNSGSAGNYADPINAALADVLATASAATPDIGDSIQPSFGSAEWAAIVDVVSGASSVQAALDAAAAAQAADQGN
jgi:alpha-glucoside transport system substrate-binding protein